MLVSIKPEYINHPSALNERAELLLQACCPVYLLPVDSLLGLLALHSSYCKLSQHMGKDWRLLNWLYLGKTEDYRAQTCLTPRMPQVLAIHVQRTDKSWSRAQIWLTQGTNNWQLPTLCAQQPTHLTRYTAFCNPGFQDC